MAEHTKPIRARTGDRGPPDGSLIEIHEAEQIGPNQALLPNGNLLCKGVPIARVGFLVYGPGETPVQVGVNGVAYVERTAEDLFDPKTIGSAMAAAIVDEHPAFDVTPDNWKLLAKGWVTTNVYPGTGDDEGVLLADIIIADRQLIKSIREGKREVSLGYDADYIKTGPGLGRQVNIVVNHLALVVRGRCGPRCSIGDREFQPEEETDMTTERKIIKRPTNAVLLARQRVADAEADLEEAETAATTDADKAASKADGVTHIHIHANGGGGDESMAPSSTVDKKAMAKVKDDATGEEDDGAGDDKGPAPIEARVAALEGGMSTMVDAIKGLTAAVRGKSKTADAEDEPELDEDGKPVKKVAAEKAKAKDGESEDDADAGAGDKEAKVAAKTRDSAALQTDFTTMLSQAEILVPGFRVPTFDAAMVRAKTIDSMCGARRKVLDMVTATAPGLELVSSVSGGQVPDLAAMDCGAVKTLFVAAAGAKALLNNRSATRDSKGVVDKAAPLAVRPGVHTPVMMNKANADFWAKQDAKAATT